jgi:Sushi repeat (SCR repeat)
MELNVVKINKLIDVKVISCGALPAPKHGRKSTFAYTPGTFVKFECDPGYVMTGEDRRWCYASAEWSWGVWGDPVCVRKSIHSFSSSSFVTFDSTIGYVFEKLKSNRQLWRQKSQIFVSKFEAK